VLVVDDHGTDQGLIREALGGEDVTVIGPARAVEALEHFAAGPIDLVVLDMHGTDRSGFGVAHRIRAMPRGDQVPILVLTRRDDPRTHAAALEAGADDLLTGPLNRTSLLIRVRSLLRISKSRRQLHEQHAALVEQRDRLLEARERQRQLASMVVHDLKSPLSSIVMGIEHLSMTEALTGGGQTVAEDMLAAGSTMNRLILNILDVARANDGRLKADLGRVDLAELWAGLLRQWAVQIKVARVAVSLELGPAPPVLRADAQLLRRVFDNLLDNALRYSPAGSRVTVRAEPAIDRVTVSLVDRGLQIGPGRREVIFRAWEGLDAPAIARRDNRGLGLAFCRLAVEVQGGRIWVEPDQGGGNAFCVSLPLSPRSLG